MAQRFRFSLETLLKVRRLREREALRNFAAKRAEIARLDRLNEGTAREILAQQDVLRQGQQNGIVEPSLLTRGRAWTAHLRCLIAQRRQLRQTLLGELERLGAALREARTQTRVLEKLRERRWTEHVHERDRRAESEADELAQQLHGRIGNGE